VLAAALDGGERWRRALALRSGTCRARPALLVTRPDRAWLATHAEARLPALAPCLRPRFRSASDDPRRDYLVLELDVRACSSAPR
jgi:hypothetical protein